MRRNVSIVYVSHDLGVVRNLVDTVAVMYAGRVVELGMAESVFTDPRHPYTRRLLEAIPRARHDTRRLRGIPGSAVEPWDRPQGCAFAPRCELRVAPLRSSSPTSNPFPASTGRLVRCWRAGERFGVPVDTAATVSPAGAASGVDADLLEVIDVVAGYRGKRIGVGQATSSDDRTTGRVLLADARVVPGRRR